MDLISIKDAAKRLSISRTTLWGLAKQPGFPRLVEITPGRKVFVAAELEAWVADRIAARDRRAA